MLRYLLREAMRRWQGWELIQVCFSTFSVSKAMNFTCTLNLLLHQTQISHTFRITKPMIKTINLTFSFFSSFFLAMDSLNNIHHFRISSFLWNVPCVWSSPPSDSAPGAVQELWGWVPGWGCREDSSLQESVVTDNDNRKYSRHSCSSSILFLTAQSHFLREIVLQCLQDNIQ